jgi:hypothetical protein
LTGSTEEERLQIEGPDLTVTSVTTYQLSGTIRVLAIGGGEATAPSVNPEGSLGCTGPTPGGELRQNKNETHKRTTTNQNSYPEMDRGEGIACADKVKQTDNHKSRSRTTATSFTKYGMQRKRNLLRKRRGHRELAKIIKSSFTLPKSCLGEWRMNI